MSEGSVAFVARLSSHKQICTEQGSRFKVQGCIIIVNSWQFIDRIAEDATGSTPISTNYPQITLRVVRYSAVQVPFGHRDFIILLGESIHSSLHRQLPGPTPPSLHGALPRQFFRSHGYSTIRRWWRENLHRHRKQPAQADSAFDSVGFLPTKKTSPLNASEASQLDTGSSLPSMTLKYEETDGWIQIH